MTVTVAPRDFEGIEAAQSHSVGQRGFPAISTLLHWLTAGFVLTMFVTGVMMKQIGDGPFADALYTFHKTTGASLLILVVVRLGYRIGAQMLGRWRKGAGSHPVHGLLYGGLILVPLLGLAGISDYGARMVYFGLSLPQIWPEGAGYSDILFKSHAWVAFGLIALVAGHIGIALGDYIQRGTQRAVIPAGLATGLANGREKAFPDATDMR